MNQPRLRTRIWRGFRHYVLGLYNEPTEIERRYARLGRIARITRITRTQAEKERPSTV